MPSKKKSTAKKSSPKKADAKSSNVKSSGVKSNNAATRKNIFTRRNGIILAAIIIIGVLLYFFKGLFIAATVNGQPVTRLELVQKLEKQGGKNTLDSLITERLIMQEMKKKNITASDEEVNAEIKKIETALKQQGRTLDEALAQQGISRDELLKQVRIQKMVEKLFAKESKVTDAEIDKYIADNKDSIPANQDEKQIRATVSEQLRQQKLASEFQKWLAEVKSKAQINYFVTF